MNAPAAISATFADFRLIKGRKQAQLVFEVPIEQADAALAAMGGVPSPAVERWVAIARLTPEAAQRAPQPQQASMGGTSPGDPDHPSTWKNEDKPRREFHSLPYAQQAALKCGDKGFQKFLGVASEDQAASRIRQECGVRSRADIESDDAAKSVWMRILKDFDAYQRGYR